MCGIAGIFVFNHESGLYLSKIKEVTQLLKHRGPDTQHYILEDEIALGHARLSIIDISSLSNQPFNSIDGRYSIIFNGEIFNYLDLKKDLIQKGHHFSTTGDVEVLLNLYIEEKENCLQKLKGFFAFSIYDRLQKKLFIARDRFGVKPLYYFHNSNMLCWASELRAVQYISEEKQINSSAVLNYLQLNYLPGEQSIIENIRRLNPGTYIQCDAHGNIAINKYYHLKLTNTYPAVANPEEKLNKLLKESVKLRLLADVPVGSFLSGGIDSTIITGIASELSPHIKTFSLGFKNNSYFDETEFAEIAAKKFRTDHHTFRLSNDDLLAEFHPFLASIDEPFADSSALNVYILSKQTKKHVKVALSGDGADEIFAGYNKHKAEWMTQNNKGFNLMVRCVAPLLKIIPQSRNTSFANKSRQLQKYNSGLKISRKERYWQWASITDELTAKNLLTQVTEGDYKKSLLVKNAVLNGITNDFNSVLLTDMNLVLPYDMLTKVDMMSMANGLEVRNPFLDHELIEFAFSIQHTYKINQQQQKIILKKAFATYLPDEITKRPKHGFEIPLQQWFKNELRNEIENKWLQHDYIVEQGVFNPKAIHLLKQQLFSSSSGDAAARVWAIVIFNSWWEKNILKKQNAKNSTHNKPI